jgi:hypothetical protein
MCLSCMGSARKACRKRSPMFAGPGCVRGINSPSRLVVSNLRMMGTGCVEKSHKREGLRRGLKAYAGTARRRFKKRRRLNNNRGDRGCTCHGGFTGGAGGLASREPGTHAF